jgi:hypothetical protein
MKFECSFANSAGEEIIVPVMLGPDEIKNARGSELHLHAHALHHAYKLVPPDFRHIANGVQRIWSH